MPNLPMNVGFQGQSGSNADIVEPSLLTQNDRGIWDHPTQRKLAKTFSPTAMDYTIGVDNSHFSASDDVWLSSASEVRIRTVRCAKTLYLALRQRLSDATHLTFKR